MGNASSGIKALLEGSYISPEAALKQFRREAAAKAGKGNGTRYKRLRDLAFEVYSKECVKSLDDIPDGQELMAHATVRPDLHNLLRPKYKVFYKKFQDAFDKETWAEEERDWLKRVELSKTNDSTLNAWWKKWNAELKRVLSQDIYEDAEGKLVYNANPPE
ncbi:MAG: hypothetical protein HN738_04885 [Gammaproteobacteria bacterium]|jgi:hypothetical protein|nr:hypothetical protein [Gammaproteobacteria bacterium]